MYVVIGMFQVITRDEGEVAFQSAGFYTSKDARQNAVTGPDRPLFFQWKILGPEGIAAESTSSKVK